MKDTNVKKLVYSALFAALCCVATMVIRIPTPTGGYVNAGDAVVLLAAFALGPVWGACAAGLGSALADIISAYALYAPGTFVIKALIALIAAFILKHFPENRLGVGAVVAGVVAELWMVLGYFLYESLILGYGMAALAGVPGNLAQAVFGCAAGAALFVALKKTSFKI